MGENKLYKQAVKEMKDLAKDIIDQCVIFADDHNYEKEWVLEIFQQQFSKEKVKFLNS